MLDQNVPNTNESAEAPATDVVYSKRFKVAQKSERKMTKATRRLAEAVVAGIETWERERDRSAGKRKDGAIRESLENYAKAYGKAVRKASKVPEDLVESLRVAMPKKLQKIYGLR